MAKKSSTSEIIRQKKELLEVLERVFRTLEDAERDYTMKYECVGKETEQARHWKTGELLWEDEDCTIPKYNNVYDYVEIPEDELDKRDLAGKQAIQEIRSVLEKLI